MFSIYNEQIIILIHADAGDRMQLRVQRLSDLLIVGLFLFCRAVRLERLIYSNVNRILLQQIRAVIKSNPGSKSNVF